MAYQPLPYAKRQKVTTTHTTLDPAPAREPDFYEPAAPQARQQQHHNSQQSSGYDKKLHGNFVGYYTRRREDLSGLDPRLALLPRDWFEGKKVLDVGCNSGMVTVEIAQRMGAARVVGVDIDEELVRLAKRTGELAFVTADGSPRCQS